MDSSTSQNQRKKRRYTRLLFFLLIPVAILVVIGCILFPLRDSNLKGAEKAYIEVINSLECPEGYGDYPYLDYLRFDLGYVDNDDIPELFLCTGNGGADTVSIYSYNEESQTVEKWGEFSSRGHLYFCEKQGITISEYGNHGYFPHIYEQVGYGVRDILAAEVEYIWEDGNHYCIAYPYDGVADDVSSVLSEYETTEKEYMEKMEDLQATYSNEIVVEYDSMTDYNKEAFHNAFNALL